MFAKTVLAGLFCSAFASVSAQESLMKQEPANASEQDPLKVSKTLSSGNKKKQAPAKAADPSTIPTLIKALTISGQPEQLIELQDQVEVLRGETKLTADRASYQQTEDKVEASGNIQLTRGEDCYTGQLLRYVMETGVGYVTKPTYYLARNNGQGKAERIDFAGEERSTITNGTYSTCQGLDPDWYLKADTLNLDTGLDTGVAGKSVLYFKGVPIIATPSWLDFSFPLSGARHSGLLPPIVGHSNKGGVEFGLPYYFNIAPNRDLTVRPKMIARRGLQLGLEGRYLGETYLGETAIEGISDKLTETTRYAINSTHTQKLSPQAVFSWNLNRASDNDYPADFSNSTTKTAQRLLLREVGLDYYGGIWNASLRSTSYQVLQDPTAPITLPYERLPQLSFHAGQNDVMGFDWSVDAMATRFWHPSFIRGNRAVINPQVSLPWIQPAFFVVPKMSFHATQYQLEDPTTSLTSSYQRSVPSVSLDTGVVFERATKFFGKSMVQTLEPRLFYVNTPYRDQSKLPLFDTAAADFNFAQIFSENRFTGHDRIGDSNQVTAGLVSRFLEEDGIERFKFALGQRFYFNTQRVSLDGKTNPSRSDILIAGSGQLSSSLSAEAALQVSQSDRQSVRSSYGIHWEPAEKKLLNLQYQFQRDVLKQIEVSGQWPISYRWYAVGKSNYSLLNRKLVEGLAGLEYRADCWALRFVAHRFATTRLNNNSGFAIQLELTGLARLGFGSNPVETLKKSISGYRPSSDNE
ncbi:LPS-assembly protein LptD [Undibacterium cyanobacteriorum]|uniref:LPS-assembly protein LptD n=1 Tax=Undibacterium cyanobacteriorum TaxID=3073561 RepID=A0ABY9RIE6_9BURK|nr:LPS-assembly protein LptD [Undibacterium sp. 20NA77.5]WMW80097.1 LPS-assembly protein LptD [Undibacterium sp. 20NA77.5]